MVKNWSGFHKCEKKHSNLTDFSDESGFRIKGNSIVLVILEESLEKKSNNNSNNNHEVVSRTISVWD